MKLSELIEKLSAYVMPEGDPEVDILIEHNNVQYEDSIGALTMSIQVKGLQATGKRTIKILGEHFE